MDDEKSSHRILDIALLNYLSQLQVSYIISSQIDKTLTAPRLLQIVKKSTRRSFGFFCKLMKNFWRILLPSAHLTKIRLENLKDIKESASFALHLILRQSIPEMSLGFQIRGC